MPAMFHVAPPCLLRLGGGKKYFLAEKTGSASLNICLSYDATY